ncbi:MAG TPA: methionyl-tRNA formyltransferase [Tepidisphaeraceae bacterium]
MVNLKIIFAGAGAFGLPSLQALIGAGHEIVQVITQPDRPAGRGRKLTPTSVGEFAIEKNLPLVRTENINALELPAADVMVVIAFGQKIAQSQVNRPRLGSVNLHASILPKYRGAAPINWAILSGETETGNSVIRLAEKMDAGAVLGQSRLEIAELETAGELHDRLAVDGGPLMLRVLDDLANGRVKEEIQDESRATIAPKLSRQSTALDFNKPAEHIVRQIRGLYPWPGCRMRLVMEGKEIARFTLVRGLAMAGSFVGAAGNIDSSGNIICNPGGVTVVELQPEGKGPMNLSAYQNGNAWLTGARLESVI